MGKNRPTVLLCERLNKANQYTEMLCDAYQKRGISVILDVQNFLFSDFIPEFVHIQWPEAIYAWRHHIPKDESSVRFINDRLRFYKEVNVPIVYTAHNLLPHTNSNSFDEDVYRLIVSLSDVIVHHGSFSVEKIKEVFPEGKTATHIVCPHGPYPYAAANVENSRKRYHLPGGKFIYLNFGRQRQNKGGEFTRSVFHAWNNPGACLFTIGPTSLAETNAPLFGEKRAKLLMKAKTGYCNAKSIYAQREKRYYRSIPEPEIKNIVAASDVFFLGHLDGLNSGILALAASFGKPVVFPDLGNFREQMEHWPWHEHYEVGNVPSAVSALDRMQRRIADIPVGTLLFDNQTWKQENSWAKHVEKIYEAVAAVKVCMSNE